MSFHLKRFLIGRPLPNTAHQHQRLSNLSALAVFASDALSSVAYATEEILLALTLVSAINVSPVLPISLCIVALLIVVTFSYRQTIHAYPTGGGAYTVAKDNLGQKAGLVAAASLLIDYILTVSVSVAAGIAAVTSVLPSLSEHQVLLAVSAVILITIGNLRGVKESGHIFAPPTYIFIFIIFLLIGKGLYVMAFGSPEQLYVHDEVKITIEGLSWLILLRAFSSGCTALTGIEAVSNGVKAFKAPEHLNASKVMLWLGVTLSTMFLGISFLAWHFHILPKTDETILSQLARILFGNGIVYLLVQASTCLILLLAANTSFNDFPRLCSLIARDGYFPRQLQQMGDRLVFSKAILLLTFFSCALLIFFGASTHRLIPLYAVGVFLSFTLSQFGMIFHHIRIKEPSWKWHLIINLTGAVSTGIVLLVILYAKFWHGAWMICAAIPLLVWFFYSIFNHYKSVQKDLQLDEKIEFKPIKNRVIIPVSNIHKGVVEALVYAYTLTNEVQPISIVHDNEQEKNLREKWDSIVPGLPLVIINNQFRSVITPLIRFIKHEQKRHPEDIITVVIPSFVPAKWWHNLLHNQSSAMLQLALRNQKNIIVTQVHVHLNK